MLNRRKFLGGVAAGVGAAKGEAPVRSTPLRANFPGFQLACINRPSPRARAASPRPRLRSFEQDEHIQLWV
jgi:hypothetical protein